MYSAYPPFTLYPVKSGASHKFSSPRRQYSQVPSVLCSHAIPTRVPAGNLSAPTPLAAIRPTTWCPGITGDLLGGSSPSMTCRSVRHTPHTCTRTSTSPAAGSGFANSPYCRGFVSTAAGVLRKHAFIVKPQPVFPQHTRIRRPTHLLRQTYRKLPSVHSPRPHSHLAHQVLLISSPLAVPFVG